MMACRRLSTSPRGPGEAQGVLAHLQAARGHAAGVGRLARSRRESRRSMKTSTASSVDGMFAPSATQMQPFFTSVLGVFGIDLVLRRAGQRDVAGDRPRRFPFEELQTDSRCANSWMRPRRWFFSSMTPASCSVVKPSGT